MDYFLCLHVQTGGTALLSFSQSHAYVGGLHVTAGVCECAQKYGHTPIHTYISGMTTDPSVTASSSSTIFLI